MGGDLEERWETGGAVVFSQRRRAGVEGVGWRHGRRREHLVNKMSNSWSGCFEGNRQRM